MILNQHETLHPESSIKKGEGMGGEGGGDGTKVQ